MDILSLPNFFIIGAAKAGTTTLYDALKKYDKVYLPYQKEPSFFCDDEYYKKGLDWYQETYYKNSNKFLARGDASARYLFWGTKVVPRIKQIYNKEPPKIIAIFRDPVKLVYSYYWQTYREGKETLSFREALLAEPDRFINSSRELMYRGKFTNLYSKIGMYASQLKPYMDYIPRENFLFLLTDDLSNFEGVTNQLEQFIGLDHRSPKKSLQSNYARLPRSSIIYKWLLQKSYLKEGLKPFLPRVLRHRMKMMAINLSLTKITPPPMEQDLVKQLRVLYRSEMMHLEDIIHRELSTWYTDE
jgi:hypothetical protein